MKLIKRLGKYELKRTKQYLALKKLKLEGITNFSLPSIPRKPGEKNRLFLSVSGNKEINNTHQY